MITKGMLEALAEYDTPLLANTLDYIDDTPPHEFYMSGEIHSVTPRLGPTVGIAVTCKFDSSTPGNKPDGELFVEQLKAMNEMDLPLVWVVETVGSRPDHECVLGDGTAKFLQSVGAVGAVTNGRIRDIAGLMTIPFPVYCRGTVVHHCALRFTEIDCPVSIGGITVRPGDIIHASDEGVIRIPPASAQALIDKAPLHRASEHEVHAHLRRSDLSIDEKIELMCDIYERNGFPRE